MQTSQEWIHFQNLLQQKNKAKLTKFKEKIQ